MRVNEGRDLAGPRAGVRPYPADRADRLIVARYARIGEAYKDALARAVAHLLRQPGVHSASVVASGGLQVGLVGFLWG